MLTRRRLLRSALLLPAFNSIFTLVACAQETPDGGKQDERGRQENPTQNAVPHNAPWLEAIALQLQKQFNLPAVWVAANIEDKVEAAVVGVRQYGDPTPATLDDLLTIDAISKPMVGVWIATLVEQGKLNYETKLLDVLPELTEDCLPEHYDISLGQLVTHTAGVVPGSKDVAANMDCERYPAERIRQAHYTVAQPTPLGFEHKQLYGEQGIILAVAMAERVAGEAYEKAATRLYHDVLSLDSWGIWPMTLADDLSVPWPHSMKGKTPEPLSPRSFSPNFARPGVSAHCSIRDLVRFGLISTNATADSRLVLKPQDWDVVMLPVPDTDFVLTSFRAEGERTSFSHNGSFGPTRSRLLVIPEWKASFAFHTNAELNNGKDWEAIDMLQDTFRKQRAALNPYVPCDLCITSVETLDETWQRVIVPQASDPQIHICIRLQVDVPYHTGDLKISVKLGDAEGRDNRYHGLAKGNHVFHFNFDTPKTAETPLVVTLDELGTARNRTPERARYESKLTFG